MNKAGCLVAKKKKINVHVIGNSETSKKTVDFYAI